jgi:hypothetical protein
MKSYRGELIWSFHWIKSKETLIFSSYHERIKCKIALSWIYFSITHIWTTDTSEYPTLCLITQRTENITVMKLNSHRVLNLVMRIINRGQTMYIYNPNFQSWPFSCAQGKILQASGGCVVGGALCLMTLCNYRTGFVYNTRFVIVQTC